MAGCGFCGTEICLLVNASDESSGSRSVQCSEQLQTKKVVNELIQFQALGVSSDAIRESDRDRVVLEVFKDDAIRCELRRGSPEQRPMLSAILGLVLAAPAILLWRQVAAFLGGGAVSIRPHVEGALVFTVGIGLWLLFRALVRKRYYIGVATGNGEVRFVFEGVARLPEIREFVAQAECKFGWRIRDTLPFGA